MSETDINPNNKKQKIHLDFKRVNMLLEEEKSQ